MWYEVKWRLIHLLRGKKDFAWFSEENYTWSNQIRLKGFRYIWTLLILSDLIMYSFPQKIMQNPSFLWGDEWGVTLPHITFHPIFYRILYHIISYFILSYGMLSYILSYSYPLSFIWTCKLLLTSEEVR